MAFKPKKVMTKSQAAKKAVKGEDMGKPNIPGKTGFAAVAAKSGGGEKGKKIAGAVFQRMRKKGQL